jgi:hypothetical protein
MLDNRNDLGKVEIDNIEEGGGCFRFQSPGQLGLESDNGGSERRDHVV